MKKFAIPEVEVIHFIKKDIIATSKPCTCVDCKVCDDDKNDCGCFNWSSGNTNPSPSPDP